MPEFLKTNDFSSICLMKLPKEALEELKDIYKKEFSEEISDNDAQVMARRLLRLITL